MFSHIFKDEASPKPPEEDFGYEVKNQCSSCRWLNRSDPETCEAFPSGIPLVIIMGQYDHTVPYSDDGVEDQGVTYEKVLFDKL